MRPWIAVLESVGIGIPQDKTTELLVLAILVLFVVGNDLGKIVVKGGLALRELFAIVSLSEFLQICLEVIGSVVSNLGFGNCNTTGNSNDGAEHSYT